MKKQFISWRRVSTFRQSKSGLGLEAQKEIIRYFIERDKGDWIADYSECYTGKELSGCKELRKAMQHAKNIGAILVIAKSDRLRNCQEALGILDEMGEGNIEFCDLPHSDRFTLTLFWALAEREALITSIRTKQALAVKKSQGALLGGANPKYRAARKAKTYEQKEIEDMKKGVTKTRRHLESRDVLAFQKVLQRCFPDVAVGEPENWDWDGFTTKLPVRVRVLTMMKDLKDMDYEKKLFLGWDFTDIEGTPLQVKLASFISNLRRSYATLRKQRELNIV